jgi:hypothetical protein
MGGKRVSSILDNTVVSANATGYAIVPKGASMDLTIHPFYNTADTANILGCKDTDIIKFGADGKLDLCVFFSGSTATAEMLDDEETGESNPRWLEGPDEVSGVLLPIAEHHLLDLYRQGSENSNRDASIHYHQFKQDGDILKSAIGYSASSVSKDPPVVSHKNLYVKTVDLVRFIESNNLQIDEASGYTFTESEQGKKARCENFVRGLEFFYINDHEIRIKEPGKRKKTFTSDSLGFRSANTGEWKSLMGVIKGPTHYYEYGPSKSGKQKIPTYDANRLKLGEINKKLAHFFEKEYNLKMPGGFKTYEKAIEAAPGTYSFKFRIGNKISKAEHQDYSRKDLIERIRLLSKRMCQMDHNDASLGQSRADTFEELSAAAMFACEKKWVTENDILDILNENRAWTPQKEVYDPFENSPDSNSSH